MKINKENVEKMRAAIKYFDKEVDKIKWLNQLLDHISGDATLCIKNIGTGNIMILDDESVSVLRSSVIGRITWKRQELGL